MLILIIIIFYTLNISRANERVLHQVIHTIHLGSWAPPGMGKGGHVPPPGNEQMGICYCYKLYVRVLESSITVQYCFVVVQHVGLLTLL